MLSLAPELIETVSRHVESLDDMKSLRLTCSHVNMAIEEQLYSRSQLTIHVVRQTVHHVTPLIVEMGTGVSRMSTLVQNLEISALSPKVKRITHDQPVLMTNKPVPDLTSEELEGISTFDSHYERAFKSLVNIKTLKFEIEHDDYHRAAKALLVLSKLRFQEFHLRVDVCDDLPHLCLDVLPPLRQLSISTTVCGGDPISDVFRPVTKTIVRSPSLHLLSFNSSPTPDWDDKTERETKPCLNEVLSECPPLPLEHLMISGFTIDGSEGNLELFRNAKSIHDSTWHDNIFRPELPIALQNAGIFKHYIDIDCPHPTIFTYLGAFSGLKSLTLRLFGDLESDETVHHFYKKVLPMHTESLETLSLVSLYDSGWCLGSQIEDLARCKSLSDLSLSVKVNNLLENGMENTVDYNLFRNLFDGFKEHKSIKRITLYPAKGNQLRGVWHRSPHFDYSAKVAQQMTNTMDALMQADMPDPSLFNRGFCLTVKEDSKDNPVTQGWKTYMVKEEGVEAKRYWHTLVDAEPIRSYSLRYDIR